MSIINEVGHNLIVMLITIFIVFLVIIGIFLLIFWFINTKINIVNITLRDILL
jgi:hypothetical protein